jgi:hypothetical protein
MEWEKLAKMEKWGLVCPFEMRRNRVEVVTRFGAKVV